MASTKKLKAAVLAALVVCTAVVIAVVIHQSDPAYSTDGPPTPEEIAARLRRAEGAGRDWLDYEDRYYGMNLRYPPAWELVHRDARTPHTIVLQLAGEYVRRDPRAMILIDPYRDHAVSVAACAEPAQATISGTRVQVCTYTRGPEYENLDFRPLRIDWSLISITLISDHGPVYVSAAIREEPPFGEREDALDGLIDDIVGITANLRLPSETPRGAVDCFNAHSYRTSATELSDFFSQVNLAEDRLGRGLPVADLTGDVIEISTGHTRSSNDVGWAFEVTYWLSEPAGSLASVFYSLVPRCGQWVVSVRTMTVDGVDVDVSAPPFAPSVGRQATFELDGVHVLLGLSWLGEEPSESIQNDTLNRWIERVIAARR